jgi:AcrR family transcriptional regulator
MDAQQASAQEFTARQQTVLNAGLDLLVEMGDGLTMTAVARRARCSKETLYKWFGGRDGLLTAIVQWQAAKVRAPQVDFAHLDATALRQSLTQFARDLLTTIAGQVSVTLNRLAISHSASDASELGTIMRRHGPAAIRRRLIPLLEAGRNSGLLRFEDSEDAYRTFFGLVVRDTQIRLLLGETINASENGIAAAAELAVRQFLQLVGEGL